ncbi:amino acid adenylation domain-containing protein [Bacillus rhizoplanae]|uniref:non-ribosomal peptide synthetase family protein n=1 Tax=Bacillus rhizoplanae TaxID=2880966 RepID=UPI003D22BBE7
MSSQIDFNISGASMGKEKKYWERKVSKEVNKTTLYFRMSEIDESQTGNEIGDYKQIVYSFPKEVSSKILGLCNKSLPNLFAFFYSAVSMLLYKYSKEAYITLEAPVLYQEDDSHTFNKKLPLLLATSPDYSFKEWLILSRNVIKETYENGNYPIHLIYELTMNPNADSPLTDILLVLEGLHDTVNLQELRNEVIIQVSEENGQLCLNIAYLSKRYRASQLLHFCEHLSNGIWNALAQMELKVCDMSFIGEAEMRKLMHDFNNTDTPYTGPMTIHSCFELMAEKTPDQIALVFEDRKLTYQELNEKSNNLAWILKGKGVGPNTIVGLMVDRSVEMIVGLLAVLKAGGSYLPIDPDYPSDRVQYMLEHSKTKLLLSNCDIDEKTYRFCDVMDIRTFLETCTNTTNLQISDNGNELAYIIYTSGSTGLPKGVMVEHSQVINLAQGMIKRLSLDNYSSFLCLTTISFDIFVLEALVPLLCGMKVVLTAKGEDINSAKLSRTIIQNNIDVMQTTPSRLLLLLNDDTFSAAMKCIKVMLCGGEPLPKLVVTKLAPYKDQKLFNMYGPTETTVWSLVKEIRDHDYIVIGKPINNTRVYILDEDGQPVPIGAQGELCISGKGVARGYLYNEEQTKSKFIPNSFVPGEKLYKTGDIARWNYEGDVEFCGRRDNQVKIRGYRIELGEIESRLLEIDGIEDAKVVDREQDGMKYLCAFYVSDKAYTSSELRDILRSNVPEYMIPSHFVKLATIPLTDNGKTNVLKLKEYKIEYLHNGVGPENVDEEFLLQELKGVLKIEGVGVTDNVFDLGANSLNIMRFIQRVQVRYQIEYADVIEHPTIREIAKIAVPRKKDLLKLLSNFQEFGIKTDNENIKKDYEQIEVERSKYKKRYNKRYANLKLSEVTIHNSILLTGSTGYLGIYLLRDLLDKTASRIVVIIRGRSIEEAVDKLRNQFLFYFNDNLDKYSERIKIYKGDLSEEKLGLSSDEYEELSKSVTCIINSAADVSHYGLYEHFYRANVQSVENLLELCRHGVKKYFCHISTTSVGNGYIEGKRFQIYTEDHGFLGQQYENNYVATKAEAEKLIIEAQRAGVATTIFRVGNLVFNSKTGQCQKNVESNAFYQRIRSLLALKIIPELPGATLEFSYIDRVSEAIVLLFNRTALQNEVFHINNPFTIDYQQFSAYLHESGREISTMKLREFLEYLSENYDHPEFKEAIEVLFIHFNLLNQGDQTHMMLSSEKTVFVLEKLGFYWERTNMRHISRMLEYGEECGFF